MELEKELEQFRQEAPRWPQRGERRAAVGEAGVLTLTRAVRVFAYAAPVDMRKGFDGLSALVEQQLGRELLKDDVFLFVGRSRRRAKVLHFDGTGLVLLTKRLFQGRFARPWCDEGARAVELTVTSSPSGRFLMTTCCPCSGTRFLTPSVQRRSRTSRPRCGRSLRAFLEGRTPPRRMLCASARAPG